MMSRNFDKFVDNLQKEIRKKEIEDHNEKIVELFHNPQNWGKLPEKEITAYHEGRGGPKGYSLGFYVKIREGFIDKASFITDGCGVMVATGSQTTLLIEGKSLEYANDLTPENIDEALGGLPEDEKHCAELSMTTLKSLIEKYKGNET